MKWEIHIVPQSLIAAIWYKASTNTPPTLLSWLTIFRDSALPTVVTLYSFKWKLTYFQQYINQLTTESELLVSEVIPLPLHHCPSRSLESRFCSRVLTMFTTTLSVLLNFFGSKFSQWVQRFDDNVYTDTFCNTGSLFVHRNSTFIQENHTETLLVDIRVPVGVLLFYILVTGFVA